LIYSYIYVLFTIMYRLLNEMHFEHEQISSIYIRAFQNHFEAHLINKSNKMRLYIALLFVWPNFT